ncbi:MAG: nucleotidyl transferase AbiEii/AbiGii toxin family protein [Actinobacteria bacterium]|nr:nucleotidyl transferase AbiEii/AbiGii toxin family protein [Actinomycetota bacterium]
MESSAGGAPETLDDIVAEAARIIDQAEAAEVPARLVGGLAIHERGGAALSGSMGRVYEDIDLVTSSKGRRSLFGLLDSLGYAANERVNMMGDGTRLQAIDPVRERQVDVFVGSFQMCNLIPIGDRLMVESRTLPLAELLLTKLQVVRMNAKDVVDIAALLADHPVAQTDGESVNAAQIARLLAADWCLWRTVHDAVEQMPSRLQEAGVADDVRATVESSLNSIWERVEAEPKGLRWKSRARLGDRRRWYDEPEEVRR